MRKWNHLKSETRLIPHYAKMIKILKLSDVITSVFFVLIVEDRCFVT